MKTPFGYPTCKLERGVKFNNENLVKMSKTNMKFRIYICLPWRMICNFIYYWAVIRLLGHVLVALYNNAADLQLILLCILRYTYTCHCFCKAVCLCKISLFSSFLRHCNHSVKSTWIACEFFTCIRKTHVFIPLFGVTCLAPTMKNSDLYILIRFWTIKLTSAFPSNGL